MLRFSELQPDKSVQIDYTIIVLGIT